jgi:hypothetical protein
LRPATARPSVSPREASRFATTPETSTRTTMHPPRHLRFRLRLLLLHHHTSPSRPALRKSSCPSSPSAARPDPKELPWPTCPFPLAAPPPHVLPMEGRQMLERMGGAGASRGSGDVAGSIRCFEMAQVGLRGGRACYRSTAHTISINRAAVMTFRAAVVAERLGMRHLLPAASLPCSVKWRGPFHDKPTTFVHSKEPNFATSRSRFY